MNSTDPISVMLPMGIIVLYMISGADTRPTTQPSRIPIVFIHGNSDIGVGDGTESSSMTGWSEMIKYLEG